MKVKLKTPKPLPEPVYICPKCKQKRNIPAGRKPITEWCTNCLNELEAELAMKK